MTPTLPYSLAVVFPVLAFFSVLWSKTYQKPTQPGGNNTAAFTGTTKSEVPKLFTIFVNYLFV